MPLIASRAGGAASSFGGLRTFGAVAAVDTGVMFPLGMVQVGSGASATISFTSIPATYTHLQLRVFVKNTRTGENTASTFCQVNNDTSTANYTYHIVQGNGSTASASGLATGAYAGLIGETPSNDLTSVFGVQTYDFIDYANTNKYKTFRTLNGYDGNGNGYLQLVSNLWLNTNAISSISLTCPAYQFAQYSQFALYGIKGA